MEITRIIAVDIERSRHKLEQQIDELRLSLESISGSLHYLDDSAIQALDSESLSHDSSKLRQIADDLAQKVQATRSQEQDQNTLPRRQGQAISADRILIVTKDSVFDYEQKLRGISGDQLLKAYESEGVDVDKIMASHQRQMNSLAQLQSLLPAEQFVRRDDYEQADLSKYDLVVAAGGDGHVQYVAQRLRKHLFFGINTDHEKSVGALTSATAFEFEDILKRLSTGEFEIAQWGRLEARVGDNILPPSLGEVYIGKQNALLTSRHTIEVHRSDSNELGNGEHKGASLLISTGAGSTGWLNTANLLRKAEILPFSPEINEGAYLLREPYRGKVRVDQGEEFGRLLPGDTIRAKSLNNSDGVVAVDSLSILPFPRGSEAQVRLSTDPLQVVVL